MASEATNFFSSYYSYAGSGTTKGTFGYDELTTTLTINQSAKLGGDFSTILNVNLPIKTKFLFNSEDSGIALTLQYMGGSISLSSEELSVEVVQLQPISFIPPAIDTPMLVNVDVSVALNDIQDVDLGLLNNGDILTYNNGTNKWENAQPSSALKISLIWDRGAVTTDPNRFTGDAVALNSEIAANPDLINVYVDTQANPCVVDAPIDCKLRVRFVGMTNGSEPDSTFTKMTFTGTGVLRNPLELIGLYLYRDAFGGVPIVEAIQNEPNQLIVLNRCSIGSDPNVNFPFVSILAGIEPTPSQQFVFFNGSVVSTSVLPSAVFECSAANATCTFSFHYMFQLYAQTGNVFSGISPTVNYQYDSNKISGSNLGDASQPGVVGSFNRIQLDSSDRLSLVNSSISMSALTGTLGVANGGTGQTTLTLNRILQGNGASAVLDSLVAPSGAIVGDTDSQLLTNKTLTDITNECRATQLREVVVDITVPSANQVLKSTGATTLSYVNFALSALSDVDLTGLVDNQVLQYDLGTLKFKPVNLMSALPMGEIYFVNFAAPVTINLPTQNTFAILNPTTTLETNNMMFASPKFDSPAAGQIRYLGTEPEEFHTVISISANSPNAGDTYRIQIFVDGVAFTKSLFSFDFTTNNTNTSVAFQSVVPLVTNNVVDIRAVCTTSNNRDIVLNNFNYVLMGCCSRLY